MTSIEAIQLFLEEFAPTRLAEPWDNVGLLVGDSRGDVARLMTCLTVTPATVAEAIELRADLIVAHHPLPFSAVNRLTTETTVGRMLLELMEARIAIYSPHTAFDSAAAGINQRLAEGLGLRGIVPIVPHKDGQGAGRCGWLEDPLTLSELAERLMKFLGIAALQMVGSVDQVVRTVGVACGSGGEFLDAARHAGSDVMVMGEARFHTCLEAEAWGMGLLLPGHFASERFGVEALASILGWHFPDAHVWASEKECDPLHWIASRFSASTLQP